MDLLNKLISGDWKVSQVLYSVITQYRKVFDKEFIEWAELECYGYKNSCDLPNYRILDCEVYAKYIDIYGNRHNDVIDTTAIDRYLHKNGFTNILVSKMRVSQCIESLEKSILNKDDGSLDMLLPPQMSALIGQCYKTPVGCNNLSAYQKCNLEQGKNIIYTVKGKLVDMLKNTEAATVNEVSIYPNISLVFISHASKDKLIIKSFIDNILKKGLGLKDENIVFTSCEATGVVPGNNIPDYIKKNIKDANVVLAMISSNYKLSEVCMNEVGAAWALGKTPIQIMLPNTNFNELGWLTHLDKAARIDDRDSLDSLMEAICDKMSLTIPTAKHWNPCTRDFLEALNNLSDMYIKE